MISLNPKDVNRLNNAIIRLIRKLQIEKNDNPMYCALDYANRVSRNIVIQKYAASYPSYSDKYAIWKGKYYPGAIGFWHLRGYLLKNLGAFRSGKGWIGGINGSVMVPGVRYGGGNVGKPQNLSDIGYRMEKGEGRQPPRPLFEPTLNEFAEEGWPKVIAKSITKMKEAWR